MNNLNDTLKDARENHIPVLLDDSALFLKEFVTKGQFLNILEIGTAVGYSGSIMLLNSPNAHLTTIEIKKDSFDKAIQTFKQNNLSNRVEQILGDAYDVILKLKQQNKKYDLIFLDGPKGQYLKYYPILLEMLEESGCLLVDNVLLHGMVKSGIDYGHKKRAMITKLRKFVSEIETRQDLKTIIHEDIGDGMAEIYKKI